MNEDPNKNLIGQIASRPPETDRTLPRTRLLPILAEHTDDWNMPVDWILSQSRHETQLIRGRVAADKAYAARWEPRPLPEEEP